MAVAHDRYFDRLSFVTAFTLTADTAQNVGDDRVGVTPIMTPDAEIHEDEPNPGGIKEAASVNLVMENRLGLERWYEQFVQRSNADSLGGSAVTRTTKDSRFTGPGRHEFQSDKSRPRSIGGLEAAYDHPQDIDSKSLGRSWVDPLRRRHTVPFANSRRRIRRKIRQGRRYGQ